MRMRRHRRLIAGKVEVPVKSTVYGQLVIRGLGGAPAAQVIHGKEHRSLSAASRLLRSSSPAPTLIYVRHMTRAQ